jgi:hypothetical protein
MVTIYLYENDDGVCTRATTDKEVAEAWCRMCNCGFDSLRTFEDYTESEKQTLLMEASLYVPGYVFNENENGEVEWKRQFFAPSTETYFRIENGRLHAVIITDNELSAVLEMFQINAKEMLGDDKRGLLHFHDSNK